MPFLAYVGMALFGVGGWQYLELSDVSPHTVAGIYLPKIKYSAPHRGAILYGKAELIVAVMRGWKCI
jgi:hypothetical protein